MSKKPSQAARPAAKKQPTRKGAASARAEGARTSPSADPMRERLRAAVETVDVAHALTMPLIRSIENVLYIAARALGAGEASVIVRDEERGGLRFLVAIGAVADKLLDVWIPPGKGVAGFVFASGQPMAVADVHRESAFYGEIDRMTGYTTQTILATPLQINGETIGVLEFINRLGNAPHEPYSPNEMDWAARFADTIAELVSAHESAGLVEMLFRRAVEQAAEPGGGARGGKSRRGRAGSSPPPTDLQRWLGEVRAAPEHRELLALAVSLREIASRGEAERRLCRDIIDSLARWAGERGPVRGVSYFE
ncbi:MAG TPA: GAF domain-containing protein [Pyrinomonadaceae bacterium]|nr:GAF domain-containing protein [Pyrinomonadaceae bacterium]